MASYKLRYPDWKKKAFTLSYDDGQVFDRRLVDMFDRYQLKATFHLNSGTLGVSDENAEFIKADEIEELFDGHEIACHGYHHPYMGQLTKGKLLEEVLEDRRMLERYSGAIVRGMSYPYGEYSDSVIEVCMAAGVEYSRTVNNTGYFDLPSDFMRWNPSCHHNNALEMVDRFMNPPHFQEMILFYVWGHSFEFERENTWEMMEEFCKKISGHDDVWYATNIEIKDYLVTMRSLITDANQTRVYNPSGLTVYLETEDGPKKIEPNGTLKI